MGKMKRRECMWKYSTEYLSYYYPDSISSKEDVHKNMKLHKDPQFDYALILEFTFSTIISVSGIKISL